MRGALALMLALIAGPVVAQDTDQLQMAADGPIWNLPTDGEFLLAMQKYGECAARDVNMQSRLVMRYPPGSKQSSKALFWTLLGSNSCSDGRRTPSALPAAYRGIVAEYYLERDFDLPAFSRKRSPVRVFTAKDASDTSDLLPEALVALPYIEAGSCVAKTDPADLASLFASVPGSDEERRAFQALQPASEACAPRTTPALSSSLQLRGYLAEGAYRYAATREAAE